MFKERLARDEHNSFSKVLRFSWLLSSVPARTRNLECISVIQNARKLSEFEKRKREGEGGGERERKKKGTNKIHGEGNAGELRPENRKTLRNFPPTFISFPSEYKNF